MREVLVGSNQHEAWCSDFRCSFRSLSPLRALPSMRLGPAGSDPCRNAHPCIVAGHSGHGPGRGLRVESRTGAPAARLGSAITNQAFQSRFRTLSVTVVTWKPAKAFRVTTGLVTRKGV